MNDALNDNLVSLEGVSYSYAPDRIVLSDCSLVLRSSERVGLTGPNGSGKSTLLGLIVGLLQPMAGRVEIFGKARSRENDFHEVRRRVGLLFQDSDDQLFCPTVAEDVAFGPLNQGKPREEVRRLVAQTLDALGLGGYEDRITYKLSGGEKRLVALATVLAMQPEVLLLDEPTSGLDHDAVERVMGVLCQLPQAMVIASHDEQLLASLCTRRLRLAGNRLESMAKHVSSA
jgi:cobalt/nickel transport system ATP-binding protein